jgi:glutathione S-transferase
MRLYNSQRSGNCYKVRLLAAQLGIPLELIEVDVVDRAKPRDFLKGKNPALRVPTLELDDGTYLAESNAILWYLGEGTPHVPGDRTERARVLQWMFFEQYSHEPNIAVVRFFAHFLKEFDEERLASKIEAGYAALDALEEHLAGNDFLVGGRYTIADTALYAYTHVAHEGNFDLGEYPAIRAWLDRIAAQPGHITIDE